MTVRVTIVLPTHNGAMFLDQAIRSLIKQTYADWELIVVDDASTDGTPGIIRRHAAGDGRIRSIRNAESRSLPGALNVGFSLARGTYLGWTSDDNRYRPEALAAMTEYLDAHPDVDVVYADYSRMDESGRITHRVRVPPPENIYFGNCIGPCFLYRRSVVERLGGYAEDLFLAEDYDFWLRANASFTLRPLPRDLYVYRDHGDSLTARNRDKILKATERALKRFFSGEFRPGTAIAARSWLSLSRRALAVGNTNLARKYHLYAVSISPGYVFRNDRLDPMPQGRLADCERRLDASNRLLGEMTGSWSWKITSPLRRLRRYALQWRGGPVGK